MISMLLSPLLSPLLPQLRAQDLTWVGVGLDVGLGAEPRRPGWTWVRVGLDAGLVMLEKGPWGSEPSQPVGFGCVRAWTWT